MLVNTLPIVSAHYFKPIKQIFMDLDYSLDQLNFLKNSYSFVEPDFLMSQEHREISS